MDDEIRVTLLTQTDTGERPYQCSLCEETFCRSDILKRHFTKCSVRRGNPHGLTHLTHARASARNSHSLPGLMPSQTAVPVNVPANQVAGIRTSWPNGSSAPQNFNQDPNQLSNGSLLDSSRSSRSTSIVRPASSGSDDKKRFQPPNGLPPVSSGMNAGQTLTAEALVTQGEDRKYSPFAYQRPGHNYQDSPATNFYAPSSAPPVPLNHAAEHPPPFPYGRPNAPQYSNGTHNVNGQVQTDWSNYFQGGAQDPLMYQTH